MYMYCTRIQFCFHPQFEVAHRVKLVRFMWVKVQEETHSAAFWSLYEAFVACFVQQQVFFCENEELQELISEVIANWSLYKHVLCYDVR